MLVNLNTIELDFDYFDADQGPSYIKGAEKIAKICTDMEGKRTAEEIRAGYTKAANATSEMLDAIFGAGTGEKVMQGKKSLKLCIDIINGLRESVDKQAAELAAVQAKYTPNRLARRAAKS